ncbi:MAG: type III pantothenate kinase [Oscillospiraceae bacterium]|jgi:type III pantothenate kinase|nr:type III pantothenate kinase [Oscillospiraceae bacterium]
MLLTVDAGNTNTVFTVFDSEKPMFEARINTDSARMADQYAIVMMDVFKLRGVDKNSIKGAMISSVVPPVTTQIKIAIEDLFDVNALLVGPGIKTGLNIKIDDPSSLGGDLACGAVAAKELYPMPCIVIDMGTIIKVMALDKTGALIGGTLSPGVRLSFESMAEGTAALPLVGADAVINNVIGTNTVDCIRSGVLNGVGAMLDGLIARFEKELGSPCTVVTTGGNAAIIKPYCERDFEVNPHLVSQGLRIIHKKNALHL